MTDLERIEYWRNNRLLTEDEYKMLIEWIEIIEEITY